MPDQGIEYTQDGRHPYDQVRLAGTGFAPRTPTDSGKLYRRRMTSLAAAPGILGLGQSASAQASAASAAPMSMPVDDPAPDGYED